jgi:transcriptional regulator with XRE-family HTH domain
MSTREGIVSRGKAGIRHELVRVYGELREVRRSRGLAQREVAAALRISQEHVSRVERGRVGAPDLILLGAHAAVLGLRLRLQLYVDADPIRDAAQLRLVDALRVRLPGTIPVRTEVPLPVPGDRRAWDAVVMLDGGWVGVEAETRLRDAQAVQRRIELKRRDDPRIARIVLLLADTAHHRGVVGSLRMAFPLGTREALAALGRGDVPPLDGIVVLRPQSVHTGG